MKKFAASVVVACACISAVFSFGCAHGKYTVYTNIPESNFSITDSSYKTGKILSGYQPCDNGNDDTDSTAFTSKRQMYPNKMNTTADLIVSDDFTKDGALEKYGNFVTAVGTVLTAVDNALSPSVSTSDINKFNEAPAGETVEITKITYEVLSSAKYVYELTDGYYNPALYYNVAAYGFGTANKYPASADELPKAEDIEKYTRLSEKFNEVRLTAVSGKYYVYKPEATVEVGGETIALKLDLGGIGKGYAADMVDILFDDYGYKYGSFSFGTSSMVAKLNVREQDFTLGLAGPRSPKREVFMTTKIRNAKISSSGDNEQRYIIDGVRYCHIIDATTGKPVQTGIMSATVIYGSAAENDALTTAIMAMGVDKAKEFIQTKLTDRAVVFTCE